MRGVVLGGAVAMVAVVVLTWGLAMHDDPAPRLPERDAPEPTGAPESNDGSTRRAPRAGRDRASRDDETEACEASASPRQPNGWQWPRDRRSVDARLRHALSLLQTEGCPPGGSLRAIELVRDHPERSVEVLARCLADASSRRWCVRLLGHAGPAAEGALPAIAELLPEDPHSMADALAAVGDAATDTVERGLRDGSPEVRRVLFDALLSQRRLGIWHVTPGMLEVALEAIERDDPALRVDAYELALWELHTEDSQRYAELMRRGVSHDDPEVLRTAVDILSAETPNDVFETLIVAMGSAEPDLARRIARKLTYCVRSNPSIAAGLSQRIRWALDHRPQLVHDLLDALANTAPAALRDLATDSSPVVRSRALEFVARRLSDHANAATVLRGLEDRSVEVRIALLRALSRTSGRSRELITTIATHVRAVDVAERHAAVDALVDDDPLPASAADALRSALRDEDVDVRLAAVDRVARGVRPKLIAARSLTVALRDDLPAVQLAALEAVESLDTLPLELSQELQRLVERPDPTVAVAGARVLATLDPGSTVPIETLIRNRDAEDVEVRVTVAESLGELAQRSTSLAQRAMPSLRGSLRDDRRAVRGAALSSLSRLEGAAAPALPELLHVLATDYVELRAAACDVLIAIGPAARSAEPMLRRQLEHDDRRLRARSQRALVAVGAIEAGD